MAADFHRPDLTSAPAGPGPVRASSGWVLAPLFIVGACLLPAPEGLSVEGWRAGAVALAMAALWISEAVPIPVTALLPLLLFPLLGVADLKGVASAYSNPLIFLFLGGFLLALAMQKHGLHLRIALGILGLTGGERRGIVAGFLCAAAAVSMWVNNTATALMMLPIAVSVIEVFGGEDEDSREFETATLLAVAYGASIGGLGTLIGTAPNALMAGFLSETYGIKIGFGQWMLFALPLLLVGLPVVYWLLTRVGARVRAGAVPGAEGLLRERALSLGSVSRGEIAVGAAFACTVGLWVFQPLLARPFPFLSDAWIALAGALALFFIPEDFKRRTFVMDWKSARGLPWDVLILFGGGLALASAIDKTGLAAYLGKLTANWDGMEISAVAALVTLFILLLTETTSNTATAATFLPVAGALAVGAGQNPLLLVIPATLAASCAFMLPVATPPNAVVFAAGRLPLVRMAVAGVWVNLTFLVLIQIAVFLLAPLVFNMTPPGDGH